MKKPVLIIVSISLICLISLIWLIVAKKSLPTDPGITDTTPVDLPINTLPLSERPFITLSPDTTGRSLTIAISGAPTEEEMEYEMVYNASGKQEGALGSIFLGSETQPITKAILLGSKSGGGKITYHEGVTGGSLTVTYATTRLKESWNYLHFDPTDPVISSTDARFSVTLAKTALKKDAVITTMKTFGYPTLEGKVVSGPYGYFTETPIKGSASVELKLPAGTFEDPTIYEWDGKLWKKLATKLAGDTVSATATGSLPAQAGVFVVTAE